MVWKKIRMKGRKDSKRYQNDLQKYFVRNWKNISNQKISRWIYPMKSNMDELEYYISTKDEHDDFIVYESEMFKMSEIDIISLIKLCLVERRNVGIGKKLLEAYRDSTLHRKEITDDRLIKIGVKLNGDEKPTIAKRTNKR